MLTAYFNIDLFQRSRFIHEDLDETYCGVSVSLTSGISSHQKLRQHIISNMTKDNYLYKHPSTREAGLYQLLFCA